MTDPLVVLFLVAANGGTEPTPSSVTDAARQALGAGTVLLVEERPSLPSDEEAVRLAERVNAGALVEVDWIESSVRHASVHVHLAQGPGWADRRIDFAAADPLGECGRTIGFSAASMITRLSAPKAVADRPTEETAPAPEATLAKPPVATQPAAPAPPPSTATTPKPTPLEEPASEERPPARPAETHRAIDVVALGALPPEGVGPSAILYVEMSPSLAAQIDGGARIGALASTQGTLTYSSAHLGAGATWIALRSSAGRPFEIDMRLDLLATELVVSREGASQSRWVPDARLEVEGAWMFLETMGVVAAAGAEATTGTTDIAIGNDIVATVRPFRAIGALGVRVRF